MLLLLSGEGPSDLGRPNYGTRGLCNPGQWQVGPVALLIDQLFTQYAGYSAIGSCAYLLDKNALFEIAKKIRDYPRLRGKNRNHEHRRGSQALACAALALSRKCDNEPVVAVYFRDCGGSRSSPSDYWTTLYHSMAQDGFPLLGLKTGVPMIPKPISEAWFICALKNHPYVACQRLETLSGSPHADSPLKKMFAKLLAAHMKPIDELIKPVDNTEQCVVDAVKINMNSFNYFKNDFFNALKLCRENNWYSHSVDMHDFCIKAATQIIFRN
jgi:hypothetical protein